MSIDAVLTGKLPLPDGRRKRYLLSGRVKRPISTEPTDAALRKAAAAAAAASEERKVPLRTAMRLARLNAIINAAQRRAASGHPWFDAAHIAAITGTSHTQVIADLRALVLRGELVEKRAGSGGKTSPCLWCARTCA